MTPSAPRYSRLVGEAIRRLDDRREPIAEICRRVNATLEEAGVTRVSYVHLRRIVQERREEEDLARQRRRELLAMATEVIMAPSVGLMPDPTAAAERVRREHSRRQR